MLKTLFPAKDTTVYETTSSLNTGVDEILELTLEGSVNSNGESKILVQFPVSQWESIGASGSRKFFLNLKSLTSFNLPLEYSISVLPLSESWSNGTGLKSQSPIETKGASWTNRSKTDLSTVAWTTPGGTPISTEVVKSFEYESDADLRVDVTTIVEDWLNGSVINNGFLVQYTSTASLDLGATVKFFSTDTHTVYMPRLDVYVDDATYTAPTGSETGSWEDLTENPDKVIYPKNLKTRYKRTETAKINLGVRQAYPTSLYTTTGSKYDGNYYVTSSAQYAIKDALTEEFIYPYDDYSKLSFDTTNGTFLYLDMAGFLPERPYKLLVKVPGTTIVQEFDNEYIFRVVR